MGDERGMSMERDDFDRMVDGRWGVVDEVEADVEGEDEEEDAEGMIVERMLLSVSMLSDEISSSEFSRDMSGGRGTGYVSVEVRDRARRVGVEVPLLLMLFALLLAEAVALEMIVLDDKLPASLLFWTEGALYRSIGMPD